ncbi:MAG: hypothetical protein ACHQFW_10845, partial [Chitinophagales bacterium]
MKKHRFLVVLVIAFLVNARAFSQQEVGIPTFKVYNFTSFLPAPAKNISQELIDQTDPKYRSNPEFGILPYDAPCKDCSEIIEKRTSNTRYYVKNGTNGKKFYSQASTGDLHFRNAKGEIITIDPNLIPDNSNPGIYTAFNQPDPTTLNMKDGYTSIRLMDKSEFKFNQGLIIYSTDDFLTFDNVGLINRTNYTAGHDGTLVTNAFNQIDQELIFNEAMVKSNYIIKDLTSVNTSKKYFVIEDAFTLPDGYKLVIDKYEGGKNIHGFWSGDLILENNYGIELARIKTPLINDSNNNDTITFLFKDVIAYQIEQNGNECKLKTIIETAWLTSESRVFPIKIDPTVFGTTATWTGSSGTDDSPNFCTVTLNVPTPAMATLTGSSLYWEFRGLDPGVCGTCKLKYMQVYITT